MRATHIIYPVVALLALSTAPGLSTVRPLEVEPTSSLITHESRAPIVLAQYVRKCAQGC